MNTWFPEIKKNFGFGCMRLPMVGDKVDIPQTTKMVDTFLERGSRPSWMPAAWNTSTST